jgi:hypothetical protein
MKLPKQDRNGARTPTDIERKYKFKVLEEVGDYGEEIELLKRNKVDKVAGKNLSTNDFTNGYKTQVEENTQARHTHDKTDEELTGAVENAHTHSNKALLDTYNQTNANIVNAINNSHKHSNKSLLDSYTNSNSDITNAINDSHYHSNQDYLDDITGGTSSISLSSYLGSGFSLLRGTCVVKNRRVCINAVVSGAIGSRTTATIFDLPNSLSPSSQKDGVAFGTTSSGSTCGWYNVSTSGVVSVWYPEAVSTYTRVNIVYDLDY